MPIPEQEIPRPGRAPRRQTGRTLALMTGILLVIGGGLAFWMSRSRPPDAATADPRAAAAARAAAPPVPVFIYLVDTLRADHLQPYGYARPTSPRLQALATEGVVFEHAYSAAPWTLPSVASLVTSTYVCEHGVVAPELKLDPAIRTLAERMKSMGYATGAYYGNFLAGPWSGLDRGYDVSEWKNDDDVHEDETRAFLDRVGAVTPFLYLHTMEPHQPYLADYRYIQEFGHVSIDRKVTIDDHWQTFARMKRVGPTKRNPQGAVDATAQLTGILASLDRMRDSYEVLYDAAVRQADDNLRAVIDVLKARNLWDTALFIAVADHGEEFGEHGIWFHEESMYEAVTHVPLVIHFPGGEHAGKRVSETVSLVDVAPTILDYLGRPELCEDCRGMSLMGLVRGEPGRGDRPLVTGLRMNAGTYYRPVRARRGDVNVVIRAGTMKGIWNEEPRTFELYDLAADAAERNDLAAGEPSTARKLQAGAAEWLRDCRAALKAPEEIQLDERAQERLRSLGYAQ